ncbi:hypothetical protein DFH09DRAFT_1314957 [Mycena vulgaris]|nr:hypothetical protein DFH09DRAFT_1314957 [Mycena vulgaris]
MRRRGYLSSKVRLTFGSSIGKKPRVKSRTLNINKTATERAQLQKDYNDQIGQMGFLQREELLKDSATSEMDYDGTFDLGGNASDDSEWDSDNEMDVDESGFNTFPPGEEAFLQSHAGGEAIFQQIWDKAEHRRGDPRTRRRRVQKQVDSWTRQMPDLIDAYLALKEVGQVSTAEDTPEAWPLHVLGFSESGIKSFVYTNASKNANETLLRHGYIGGSPDQPTIAFSVKTFEIYRQVHRVCPRFSLDALAKTLNHLHRVPKRPYLAEQLSTAYDAYLAIIRGVDRRVQAALGRNEQWKAKNICPPCFYKIRDELPLKLSFLGSIDGNNSLKLVDSTFRAGRPRFDNRKTDSFRWLTAAEVDFFKDEVKTSPKVSMATAASVAAVTAALASPPAISTSPTPTNGSTAPPGTSDQPNLDAADDDIAWLNVNELTEAESDELANCVDTCVERWKNAGPEARKKMFALFAFAGIFIAVCRHGHVLVICDMIRSGELMKYPLAVVKPLLDLYGADIGLGYDIMCAFYKTLLRSSLGRCVVGLNLRGVVPAFHGHAHNRGCQVDWHPLYVEGVGLEDFEECERTFCLLNNLATVTRLCTPFHRQQQIDEHFAFHDVDKHAASGNFIFQNYRQATEKVAMNSVALQALEQRLHTTSQDYENYLTQERDHLERLKREPPEVAWTVDYMELLMKRAAAEKAASDALRDHSRLDFHIINDGWTAKQIQSCKTKYRTTYQRCLMLEEELSRHEEEHGIAVRWTPAMQEYKEAVALMTERRYRRALDTLERLVVSRRLELTKLGMSGVGYKLREKIGKALKTRAVAIQRAIAEYNSAAAVLTPPRQQLNWAQVVETVSLAEFDFLRDTRTDIRTLPWADPARREAMALYFGIKRSNEEIDRLNVEIRRLLTFMIDDHVDYYKAIATCITRTADLGLARELSEQWEHRSNINQGIVERLVKASRLVGFTGSLFPGEREGRDTALNDNIPLPIWAASTLGLTQVVVEYEEGNEADDTVRELQDVDTDLLGHVMETLHLGI